MGWILGHKSSVVWDIPAIQARAGADIPRDFLRAQPEGNPEEYLHLPELGWQE